VFVVGDDVLVLCYHAVSHTWRDTLAVTPATLERQLAFLIGRGYRGATFREAVTSPPAPRTLAVTFDDASRSVWNLAVPILSRFGLPGTIFVPTRFPGSRILSWPGIDTFGDGAHPDELVPMSWDELRAAADMGWEVGSHTRTHPHLTALSDRELEEELRGSREDCEAMIERSCESIAYPYGDHDLRVVAAARRSGYLAGGTLQGWFGPPTPLRWPRVGVYPIDRMLRFRAKVLPAARRIRATAAGLAGRADEGKPDLAAT
jgi:peptidoglycan/xylan/chitin deacetylase (PgdA/CDA1 family)